MKKKKYSMILLVALLLMINPTAHAEEPDASTEAAPLAAAEEPAPEPEAEPAPAPDNEADNESELPPESESTPVTAPESVQEAEPVQEPEPVTEADPMTEPTPDTEADPDTAPIPDTESDTEPTPDTEPAAEPEITEANPGIEIRPEVVLPEEIPASDPEELIQVVVPSEAKAIVNPYRMEVNFHGETSTEEILSDPVILASYSKVPVKVGVTVTGRPATGSEVTFAGSPSELYRPGKTLFLYMEFQSSEDGTVDVPWLGVYTGASNQLILTPEGVSGEVLTLPAGIESPACGVMKVFGEAYVGPGEVWSMTDTVELSAAFTFTPII